MIVRSRLRRTILCVALTLDALDAAAQTPPAAAPTAPQQVTAPGDEKELPPVTVNAAGDAPALIVRDSLAGTKTDTPLIEIPQSISVVSQQQIRDQGAQSLGALIRYSAGVLAEENGGVDGRYSEYMIRGFTDTMPFVDGLSTAGRYSLLAYAVEPYGLERAEVVRGPVSVLYGQIIPGGMIHLESKRPTDAPFREVELQGGNFDRAQVAFDVSDRLVADGNLSYRLTGLFLDSGTQIDHVDDRRLFIAPALAWKPSGDTSLTLLTHYRKQDAGTLQQNLPMLGTLVPAPFGYIPTNLFIGEPGFNSYDRDEYALGYAFEHRFNDRWTLRQNLRYAHTNLDQQQIGGEGFEPGTTLLDRFTLASNAWQKNLAIDTQLEGRFNLGALQHTVVMGFDYTRSHDQWIERDGETTPLDVLAPVYGTPIATQPVDFATDDQLSQFGIYAQDQVRAGPWIGTFGLREDHATLNDLDLLSGDNPSQRNNQLTGRAGITYLFDPGWAAYANYSTSFIPSLGTTFDGEPFKPNTGQGYEGGLKFQAPDNRVSMIVSAYRVTEQNVLTTDPDHPFFLVSTGEVRVDGLELSLTADLENGLKAILSATAMNPRITKSNDPVVGNRPTDVPRNMASLWVDKTLQGGAWRGFGFAAGVRYVGARFGDDANTLPLPATTLYDAALHYTNGHWRAALNVANVSDEHYVGACYSESFCFYGQRRTVIGSLGYTW